MRLTVAAVAIGVGIASLGYSPASHANLDQLAASVCDYVASDDKNRLRRKLKDHRLKLRNIYDNVQCEGVSLLRLAMIKDAQDVGVFIAKQVPKRTLTEPESDGATVLQWAESNGHGGSQIVQEIGERTAS
ncbi:DUF3718 domain-containing protein [Ferrimonas marina]|uniref:DUF3718 domain-containing protein n=1 Tax=Ferrimonas marina TaxID=299255 RepID=A0A1M5ZKY0_9GAMM|nr:DUF3718 domain-containing protein [Ferrimonas marina]SHI24811.1 Protein of unknown function [Ferrimonas marina]